LVFLRASGICKSNPIHLLARTSIIKEGDIFMDTFKLRTKVGVLVLSGLLALSVSCKKDAKPTGPKLEKPAAFPYELFDKVVKAYVDDQGRVNYTELKKSRADLDSFVNYVGQFGPTTASDLFPSKEAKQAYYINAYNALVMKNILDQYPPAPMNDKKTAQVKFFVSTKFIVDGKELNLNQLESDIVRPVFKDPRNHFALNCGALGCPQLPQEAFFPDRLNEQLDRETKKFVMESRNVRVDGDTVSFSDIPCSFYPEDFVEYEKANGGPSDKKQAVLSYFNRYRPDDQKLAGPYKDIKCIPYNWTPNDQALAK
jgi:hypothetical protein